jgi:DNA (cytosine-5)-methyltransferase 1
MTRAPRAVDVFAGAGGMSLGFEHAGFDVVAAVDNNPINVETYGRNFPGTYCFAADVSELTAADLRAKADVYDEVDVLFGGPPCQGFSVIGKRRSEDPRNELLIHFARLLDELKPKYFVVENVRGLLIGDARSTLDRFMAKARAAGYSIVEPLAVLDAQMFGVPQQRRRLFVLGYRSDVSAPTYPEPIGERVSVWAAIGDLACIDDNASHLQTDIYTGPLGKASEYALRLRGTPSRSAKNLTGCARSIHSVATVERFAATMPGKREPISKFDRLSPAGVALTLRAGTGPENGSYMAPRPIHPVHPRCITVREAARLHSFPDSFQFDCTKWHGFRQVGNSVPPLLAAAVARSIHKALKSPPVTLSPRR